MPWFGGTPLLWYLEHLHVASDRNLIDSRLPVQWVIRPRNDEYHDYRGYAGQIAGGIFKPGDEVLVLPSERTSRIARIETYDGALDEAFPPMAVTVHLEDDLDVSRGDMICRVGDPHQVEATLIIDQADIDLVREGHAVRLTLVADPIPVESLLAIVAAAFAIAETGVIVKRLPRAHPVSNNALAMGVGGLVLLGAALLAGQRLAVPAQAETIAAVGYLVVVGSVALFMMFLYVIERWTASATSYSLLLKPLPAAVGGALLLGEQITVGQTARHVHLSRYHFCKVFRKATGMTFTQFMSRVRIENAKDLLSDPYPCVSEVARRTGYVSISQFNRAFRRWTGQSPGKWRRRRL